MGPKMITDEQVRWIALFFLFSFMDESLALQSAHKTIAQLKATGVLKNGMPTGESVSNVALIRALRKILEQQKKSLPRNRTVVPPDNAWIPPDHMDMGPWAKFQKAAAPEQLVAVILSRILKFKDHEIAEGLNVSLGTARYRIGKGVRQLGSFTRVVGR